MRGDHPYMSQIQHSIVGNAGEQFVTVFIPGGTQPLVAGSDHPNFSEIITALTNPYGPVRNTYQSDEDYADYIVGLFDLTVAVAKKFDRLSERVTVANGRIYLDGEEIDNALTRQIRRFLDEGVDDWKPLVNFFEKVLANPQEHSRTQLYEWLSRHDFTITPEGDIVGYKGVAVRTDEDGDPRYVSIHAGPAIVDGEEVNGQVPNDIGSVVEMARGSVQHDPSIGCHTGLHVGTWSYASSFAQGAVLEVHVNPRDVVSVPTDCNWQKVRCCRYTVVDVKDVPYSSAVLDTDGSRDDDDHFVGEYEDDGDLGFEDPVVSY